jgi:hypothetical protein
MALAWFGGSLPCSVPKMHTSDTGWVLLLGFTKGFWYLNRIALREIYAYIAQ